MCKWLRSKLPLFCLMFSVARGNAFTMTTLTSRPFFRGMTSDRKPVSSTPVSSTERAPNVPQVQQGQTCSWNLQDVELISDPPALSQTQARAAGWAHDPALLNGEERQPPREPGSTQNGGHTCWRESSPACPHGSIRERLVGWFEDNWHEDVNVRRWQRRDGEVESAG